MILDHASGAELLAEARRTLLETIMPSLPAQLRYDGLMIANAMAIASREITEGGAAQEAMWRALAGLREGANSGPFGAGALARLERQIASDIRAGLFDAAGSARDRVRRVLRVITAERLRISNPKALADGSHGNNK